MPVIVLVILIGVLALSQGHAQVLRRPFMLVSSSEYDSLRARSARWPWSVMKEKAIQKAESLAYDPSVTHNRKTGLAHDLASACALGYILDPSRRERYVGRVERDLRAYIHDIRVTKETSQEPADHGMSVGPAHASFMTYVVLDIMYDDLDPTVRELIEEDCDYIATHHYPSWFESKYAIEALTELYHHGPSEEFRRRKDTYRNYLLGATSVDGVYATGPGYAHSRLFMEDRSQKKMFMDVCEYQGIHEFYSEPKFQRLYEWVFGYSVSPFNRTYTFGDSPPTKLLDEYSSAVLRVGRFSKTAQSYAAWHLGAMSDAHLKGGLLPFLMCDGPMATARAPVSRIFQNGGAWLLQNGGGKGALAGVLWNVATSTESHSHYDANSINIEGFGEHIFRNSGYDGWKEPDSAGWEWIHRDARSSNTLTLGSENHVQFRGAGIEEGIVGGNIEYACGISGPALRGGAHARNLVFVQPEGTIPGYFVLVDEVKTESSRTPVNLYLHPNATVDPDVIVPGQDYIFRVRSCFSSTSVSAKVFLLRRPEGVRVFESYRGSTDECNRYQGKSLDVSYISNERGESRVGTVIVPFQTGQPPPGIARLADPGYGGMLMSVAPGVEDVMLVMDDGNEHRYGKVRVDAFVAYWRESHGESISFFVKRGTRWIHGATRKMGFESERAVTLSMTGDSGAIISPGTTVTFFRRGVRDVMLDGALCTGVTRGNGSVRVEIPPGNHRIELVVPERARGRSSLRYFAR